MRSPPFLSIIIPTRDRPQFLKHALWSALHQSDQDFEVIVCDNPKSLPARSVFDEIVGDHPNFRYVRPQSDLNMVDNWNFALSHASGNYVTLLEDKFALRLDCIEFLKQAAQGEDPEIVSWYPDSFQPANEDEGCDDGVLLERSPEKLVPCAFEPRPVLDKRLGCGFVRGTEGGMYCMGKIVFGAFHRNLIKRIIDQTGNLFQPIAPDYTSMTAALLLANSAIDLGRSLCIAVHTTLSNGALCQRHVRHAENFLASYGAIDEVLERLPVPRLPTSAHNLVAHDYLSLCRLLPDRSQNLDLNWSGLYLQCEKELGRVVWVDENQKKDHYQRLRSGISNFPVKHRAAIKVRNMLRDLPGLFPNWLADRTDKFLFRSGGKKEIHLQSQLWQRWTYKVSYHVASIAPLGLNASLLYLYYRDHSVGKNAPPEPENTTMNTNKSEIPSTLKSLTQTLDPAVSSLIENLISKAAKFESGEEKRKADERIDQLEKKLENFRGMIARRDARIEKLEAKLERK